MLDIFQFGAIYAPTPEISTLIEDISMQEECAAYISPIGEYHPLFTFTSFKLIIFPDPPISTSVILALYTSFHQGQTVKSWCIEHQASLSGVDIRRFVTFGVIKGFLYRVHKYPVHLAATSAAAGFGVGGGAGEGKKIGGDGVVTTGKTSANDRRWVSFAGDASSSATGKNTKKKKKEQKGAIGRGSRFRVGSLIRKTVKEEDEEEDGDEDGDGRTYRPTHVSPSPSSSSSSISSRSNTHDHNRRRRRPKKEIDDNDDDNGEREEEEQRQVQRRLWKFLNGGHCLDEICTELGMSEKDVLKRIRSRFPSPPPPSAPQIPRSNSSSLPLPPHSDSSASASAGIGVGIGEANDRMVPPSSSSSLSYPFVDRHRSRGGVGGRGRSEKERLGSGRRGGEELILGSNSVIGGTGPTAGIGVGVGVGAGVEMVQIVHR